MRAILTACGLVTAAVLAQDIFPGRALYHAGWFNVLLASFVFYAALRLRRLPKAVPERTAVSISVFGTAVIAFAGLAAGLLGPDTQTFIGVPGTSMHVDGLGALEFPLVTNASPPPPPRRRYSGSFILEAVPRPVVYVSASDARGNHLTITQPSGSAFLSPVLLMQSSTRIAGMTVPFDTFTVPASRRNVKAVLFEKQQAAQLRTRQTIDGKAAVLFAVSGTNERIVPGGIAIVADGGQRAFGGLILRARVIEYPAIQVASGPNTIVLVVGLVMLVFGAVSKNRFRWRS